MNTWPGWTLLLAILAVGGLIWKGGSWYGAVNSDRKSFKEFMNEVRADIKQIKRDIGNLFGQMGPQTDSSGSPRRLTDFGEAISRNIQAKEWAGKIAPTLDDEITGKLPYEVQDFCFAYVEDRLSMTVEQEKKTKACAYERGIDVNKVLRVLAIELRDILLEKAGLSAPD